MPESTFKSSASTKQDEKLPQQKFKFIHIAQCKLNSKEIYSNVFGKYRKNLMAFTNHNQVNVLSTLAIVYTNNAE